MSRPLRDKLASHLVDSERAGMAQTASDAIMRTLDLTRESARKQVDSIKDPELRDRVSLLVERDLSHRDAIIQEHQVNSFESLAKGLEGNGGDLNNLSATNADAWDALNLQQRDRLRNLAGDIAKGRAPAPLGIQFLDLQQMAATPELREKFLKTPLATFRGQMTNVELGELATMQARLRANPTDGGEKLASISSMEHVVSQALQGRGINPSMSEKNEQHEDAVAFRREFQSRVWEQERSTGKRMSEPDMLKISDALTREVVKRGEHWYNSDQKVPVFKILAEVPELERDAIRAEYKRQGKPDPSSEDVLRIYGAKKQRDATKGR
jgi:hypothetical protein